MEKPTEPDSSMMLPELRHKIVLYDCQNKMIFASNKYHRNKLLTIKNTTDFADWQTAILNVFDLAYPSLEREIKNLKGDALTKSPYYQVIETCKASKHNGKPLTEDAAFICHYTLLSFLDEKGLTQLEIEKEDFEAAYGRSYG